MPRQARKKSKTGIYHIMMRGINQQIIFEDEEDNEKFISTLKTYEAVSGYKLFAYCLMHNHIHLLIKVENEELELIFKRICGSYAYWYNWKYRRIGHLFQDRFKSEEVEDEKYLLTVLRYIHRNPINAGVCDKIDEWKFSSYNEIISENSQLIDTNYIYSIIAKEQFIEFNKMKNDDECLECDEKDLRLSDLEAKEIIESISKCKNATEFQYLDNEKRDKFIKEFKNNGLSIRQISRLTGISFAIVRKP